MAADPAELKSLVDAAMPRRLVRHARNLILLARRS